jgi:GT2 family glycosyltransferase
VDADQTVDISVIIVNWNARRFLARCLESITAASTCRRLEVIVVDNDSRDGSREMVAADFPFVTLIANSVNQGFARGNNTGIRRARGRYLFLINSDVEVRADCFDRLAGFLDGNPGVGLAGPAIVTPSGAVQRSCMGEPTLWNTLCRALFLDMLVRSRLFGGLLLTYWDHGSTRDVDIVNGCFWAVRRDAFDDVGYLDEDFFMYGEDMDWCTRFRRRGWRVAFCSEAAAVHHGGASSANAPARFYVLLHQSNLRYWRKYHGAFSTHWYRSILVLHQLIRALSGAGALLCASGRTARAHRVRRALTCAWALASARTGGPA